MDPANEIAKKDSGWWGRRTTMEKSLVLIISAISMAVIALLIQVIYIVIINTKLEEDRKTLTKTSLAPTTNTAGSTAERKQQNDTCLTKECFQTASSVLDCIDFSVQPCDDFYSFACGTFVKVTHIPVDDNKVDTSTIIKDKLSQQLRSLVSEEPHEDDPRYFKLVNDLFRSCLKEALIEKRGNKPMLDIIESLGGWPAVQGDSWDKDSWTLAGAIKKFKGVGLGDYCIFRVGTAVDAQNSTKRILVLFKSIIDVVLVFKLESHDIKLFQEYCDSMVDVAVIFGANRERAEIDFKALLSFQSELAVIASPDDRYPSDDEIRLTINELQNQYPYFNWLDYINSILPDGLNVDGNEVVISWIPSLLAGLGPLLEKTPKRVIANYMMWSAVVSSSPYLTDEIRSRQRQFNNAVLKVKEVKARWKECTEFAALRLPIAVGAIYIRKYFHESDKKIALEMVNEILVAFQKILKEIDWMDDNTRQFAIDKLNSVVTHIGYPVELTDDAKIEEYHKNLQLDKTKYLESFLNITEWRKVTTFNRLRKLINKTDWIDHADPIGISGKFSPNTNSIRFPAGMLQGKFFSAARPKYMNYGSIGSVIGQTIMEGFDDRGRFYNIIGDSVQWWEESTVEAYNKKAKCIIEQYGNFTDKATGIMINGINTLDENIADNGGVKMAYLAYKQWVHKNGPELKLPGLQFSPEQLFWISMAQTLCANYKTEILKLNIHIGKSPPANFRVQGTLGNSEYFAKDFNCPKGSPMNPNHKCSLW